MVLVSITLLVSRSFLVSVTLLVSITLLVKRLIVLLVFSNASLRYLGSINLGLCLS